MSTISNFAPSVSSSSGHTTAFIATRSMTPRKSLSAPIGSWTTTGTASRRSRIISTQRSKSAPTRSILLTKQKRGHVVLVGLAPHRLGLRLDTGDRVEHRDRAVEDAQRPLDLDGEVDVAGRVDDVDLAVVPLRGGGGGGDRDAALLLLDHVVHHRGAFVHLTDLVGATRVVEDALGRRGLTRVDVSHDPDVAGLFEGKFACHLCVVRFSLAGYRGRAAVDRAYPMLGARSGVRGSARSASRRGQRRSTPSRCHCSDHHVLIVPFRCALPAVVRKSFVRFRHLLKVFPALDRRRRCRCWRP